MTFKTIQQSYRFVYKDVIFSCYTVSFFLNSPEIHFEFLISIQ